LVQAADGTQLWADAYEFHLEDIFSIQEEMARQIAASIEPELAAVEQQLASRKAPENLDAWDCYQRGLWHLWAFTTPGFDAAEHFFRRAIEIDPQFARAHGGLGYVEVQRTLYATPQERPARLAAGLQFGRAAVALDERDCYCHCVLGRALSFAQEYQAASDALEHAIELNPSFAQGFFAQGFNKLWAGRQMEAEALLDRATLLSPRDSHLWSFHHVRACVHFSLEEMDTAAEFARLAAQLPNSSHRAFATWAASLGQLGRKSEAEQAAEELARRKPGYSVSLARDDFFFCRDEKFLDHFVEGLKVAGVPAD
jgi:tetratricopeptide (TPR) repeat protein